LLRSEQEQGILVLNNAIASCTEAIEQHKGKLVVKEAPRAVSVTLFFYGDDWLTPLKIFTPT